MSTRLLIVDDDLDIRRAIADVLEEEGYEVCQASNGQEALEQLSRSTRVPGIILLDMMMPVMDGASFIARSSEHPRLAQIPIIIFSAHENTEQVAASLGVAGYLKKPLRLTELLEKIEQLSS